MVSSSPDEQPFGDKVRAAYAEPVLRSFGVPDPSYLEKPGAHGLVALHLGAAYHRLSVVLSVMRFYARRACLSADEFPALTILSEAAAGREPQLHAVDCYAYAIKIAPTLAEAHFGLARVRQSMGEAEGALAVLDRVLRLSPHPNAPPEALLHANAHWERATILEEQGYDWEALKSYRVALTSMGSFGVHHVRVARFMRRLGLLEEAVTHFRRCMGYTHRYFAEFMLPPLSPPVRTTPPKVEPILETSRGEVVVFWQGSYYAVPNRLWPMSNEHVSKLAADPEATVRKSSNIAAFED